MTYANIRDKNYTILGNVGSSLRASITHKVPDEHIIYAEYIAIRTDALLTLYLEQKIAKKHGTHTKTHTQTHIHA